MPRDDGADVCSDGGAGSQKNGTCKKYVDAHLHPLFLSLAASVSRRVPLSLPFSSRSPLTPRAQLRSIEASSEDEGQDDPSSPHADSPRSDSETAPAAPTVKSREMEILEEAMAAAESSLAGLQADLHSAQVLLECGTWLMVFGGCLHSLRTAPSHAPLGAVPGAAAAAGGASAPSG